MRMHAAGLALVTTLLVAHALVAGALVEEAKAQPPRLLQERAEAPDPIEVDLAVGQVHSIPAAGIQSYSSSGSLLEIAHDAARNTLDVHMVRAGSAALLLIRSDGSVVRYDFRAR